MEIYKPKKVVVICSGGMDSTTLLYHLKRRKQGEEFNYEHEYEIVGVLSFDYGQKHSKELVCAGITCKKLKLEHKIITLAFMKEFNSALTSEDVQVPEGHYKDENMKTTVVPNRNMIMLSIAIGYAVSKDAELVAYGAHSGDHLIYPDCRPEFIEKMNEVAKIANFQPVELFVPFQNYTKKDILELGFDAGVPYKDTWTCYVGGEKACGKCGSCQERLEAFASWNIPDPLDYETREIIKKK